MFVEELPNEVLVNIADFLASWTDALSFRLVNKRFARAGFESLCKCVYLHPSPAALSRFEQICNDDNLNKKIKELVLLGPSEDRFRHVDVLSSAAAPFRHLANRPWPQFFTTSTTSATANPTYTQLYIASNVPFLKAYKRLLQLIARLTQLSTACYASEPFKPGLNPVSTAIIRTWAQANEDYSGSFGGPGQPPVKHAKWSVRWSDTEVFLGVLASMKQPSRHIAFHLPLLLTHYVRGDLFPGFSGFHSEIFKGIGVGATSLEYTADDLTDNKWWASCCSTNLRGCTNLEELRCLIQQSPGSLRWEVSVGDFLSTREVKGLSMVEIVGISERPFSMPQWCFPEFLRRHCETLKIVTLANITVNELHDAHDFGDTMEWSINTLKDVPQLTSASWRLRRLEGQNRYQEEDALPHAVPALEVLDTLAGKLGVTVDTDGYWDFGEYVLRKE